MTKKPKSEKPETIVPVEQPGTNAAVIEALRDQRKRLASHLDELDKRIAILQPPDIAFEIKGITSREANLASFIVELIDDLRQKKQVPDSVKVVQLERCSANCWNTSVIYNPSQSES